MTRDMTRDMTRCPNHSHGRMPPAVLPPRVFVMRILFSVFDLFSAVMRTRRASTIRIPCLAIVFALTVPAALSTRCGVRIQYFEFSYL